MSWSANLRGVGFAALAVLASGCFLFRPEGKDRPLFFRVRPAVAFEMLRDSPDLPILDLRRAEEFNGDSGHLAGARNLPLEEIHGRLAEIADLKDHTFLIYCRAGDCAHQGLTMLVAQGFENCVLMDGGIEAWIEAGFGTVGGSLGGQRARGMPAKRKPPGKPP